MTKQKINPRRRPATMMDVKRAKNEARLTAMHVMTTVIFSVLQDKEGFAEKDLRRVWQEVDALAESIALGYCTLKDLRETLKLDSNIVFTLGGKLVR